VGNQRTKPVPQAASRPLRLLTLGIVWRERIDQSGATVKVLDLVGLTPDDHDIFHGLAVTTHPISFDRLIARAADCGFAVLIRSDLKPIE
jgi:hypothetical protein